MPFVGRYGEGIDFLRMFKGQSAHAKKRPQLKNGHELISYGKQAFHIKAVHSGPVMSGDAQDFPNRFDGKGVFLSGYLEGYQVLFIFGFSFLQPHHQMMAVAETPAVSGSRHGKYNHLL